MINLQTNYLVDHNLIILYTNIFIVLKVADIRNSLSHVKVTESLGIDQTKTDTHFKALSDLVDCLINLHPKYFKTDLLQELRKVSYAKLNRFFRISLVELSLMIGRVTNGKY